MPEQNRDRVINAVVTPFLVVYDVFLQLLPLIIIAGALLAFVILSTPNGWANLTR